MNHVAAMLLFARYGPSITHICSLVAWLITCCWLDEAYERVGVNESRIDITCPTRDSKRESREARLLKGFVIATSERKPKGVCGQNEEKALATKLCVDGPYSLAQRNKNDNQYHSNQKKNKKFQEH
eukprot:6356803-Amphidinium_carterae.1